MEQFFLPAVWLAVAMIVSHKFKGMSEGKKIATTLLLVVAEVIGWGQFLTHPRDLLVLSFLLASLSLPLGVAVGWFLNLVDHLTGVKNKN